MNRPPNNARAAVASGRMREHGRPDWAGGKRPGIPRTRSKPPETVIADNPNWHRFKMACPFYRERWVGDEDEFEGREVLYHVICLQNMPPETLEEQESCLEPRVTCWRQQVTRARRSA